MAKRIQVLIDSTAGQSQGDWKIAVGGRDMKNDKGKTRHFRKKSAAIKEARQEGRKIARDGGSAVLQIQNTDGTMKNEATYGDSDEGSERFGFFKKVGGVLRGRKNR